MPEEGHTAHNVVGYVVAGALSIRLVWGFVGSKHARFSDFVPSPGRLARYVRALVAGREERYVGHNPAGATMILILMALLAAVSATGWMLTLDAFWGNEALEEIHGAISNAILGCALIHAAAVLYESHRQGENLVMAMITTSANEGCLWEWCPKARSSRPDEGCRIRGDARPADNMLPLSPRIPARK